MNPVIKHFVTFHSPGTLFAEETVQEISSRDPKIAVGMAEKIVERYNAKPYGFKFFDRAVAEVDGETLLGPAKNQSGTYFLGGSLESYDDLEARNYHTEEILRSNMRGNGWWVVCINTNGWKSSQPFEEQDCVVDATGAIVDRGDSSKWVGYRTQKQVAYDADMLARFGK